MGLNDKPLPDMDKRSPKVSHAFYDNNLRGGEEPMEIEQADPERRALEGQHDHLGEAVRMHHRARRCRTASSRSSPCSIRKGIFLPIETNGDSAVNVFRSRVQMQLFKAKQLAQKEVDKALVDVNMTIEVSARTSTSTPT